MLPVIVVVVVVVSVVFAVSAVSAYDTLWGYIAAVIEAHINSSDHIDTYINTNNVPRGTLFVLHCLLVLSPKFH